MKKNRLKIATCIFSVAVLFTAVSIGQGAYKNNVSVVSATTAQDHVKAPVVNQELSRQQLRDIAQRIVPGTFIKEKYDYENGQRVMEFDIIDKNGVKREITLFTSNGKVYDIDHDYDAQGNRFINKDHFDVKVSFEQAQQIALNRIPGTVLAHKQDANYGLFIYEFIVRGNNGVIYEVDVETKNGTVLKVEIEDDYHPNNYGVPPVVLPGVGGAPQFQPNNQVTTQPQPPVTTPQVQPQPEFTAPVAPPAPSQPQGVKSEAELRKIVLSKFPGTVLYVKKDWDDGMMEYDYRIRQNDGKVVEVEVNSLGWIKDVDYEGQYINGVYYDWD